jgi:exodeoxyribonuclease V gamma subunit
VLYNAPAEKQRSEGWKQWHGSDRSWGESSSDAWQLLLRGPTRSLPTPATLTCCATASWSSARCAKAALGTEARQEGNA